MAAPRTVKWRSPRPVKASLPAESAAPRTTVKDFSLRPLQETSSPKDDAPRPSSTAAAPSTARRTDHLVAQSNESATKPNAPSVPPGRTQPAAMTVVLAPRRKLHQLGADAGPNAVHSIQSAADAEAAAPAEPRALPALEEIAEPPSTPAASTEVDPMAPPSPSGPDPTAAPETPAPEVPSQPSLFRSRALQEHSSTQRSTASLDALDGPTASWWTTILFLLTVLIALIAAAAFASVETTAEAQGALRAPNGLRPVSSPLAASVTEVLVQPGQTVERGQVLIRLEAADLAARLERLESSLSALRTTNAAAEARDEQANRRASQAIDRQRSALHSQVEVGRQRERQRRTQAAALEQLVEAGGASQQELQSATERVQGAKDALSSLLARLATVDLEQADRLRGLQERAAERNSQRQSVEQAIQETQALLRQTQVKAPASGIVESLVVTPGSVTQSGQILAQIVPSHTPRHIVAFLSAREASFLEIGATARVELASLPESEFGAIHATVTRLSRDVASTQEVVNTLGTPLPGPVVRVELQLVDANNSRALLPHLRSGERVVARLHRRDRRVLGLLFDFLRDWTDP